MPPKKHKSEEEPENPEPIGRRTRSASLGPPAIPPPPTPSSRATTRSRARQDGTTEILDGLPASIKRVPSRKKSASPMRSTKTPGLRIYPVNPTARSEDALSESTDNSEVYTPNVSPISAHLGEGNLPTLVEADESDFSAHVSASHFVLPPSLTLCNHIKDLTHGLFRRRHRTQPFLVTLELLFLAMVLPLVLP